MTKRYIFPKRYIFRVGISAMRALTRTPSLPKMSALVAMSALAVTLALAVMLALTESARAQLYSCKGEDGRNRYVSSKSQCPSAYTELPSSYAKPKSPAKKPAAAESPGQIPKVSARAQSELDRKRGAILLYELRREQRVHAAMEEMVADAETDDKRARLQKLRDEHARNIAAIRRELTRLGYEFAPR